MTAIARNNWASPYHIQTDKSPELRVDAWSTQYISFEPKEPWKKGFRQELFQAVNRLNGHKHKVLHSIYEFAGNNRSDIENVLFYNIDQTYFSALPLYGLRWERGFRLSKPCPVTLIHPQHHHYTYLIIKQDHPFIHWRPGDVLARWWTTLPNSNLLQHPTYLWHFLKSSSQPILFTKPGPIRNFGIRVFIDIPKQVNQRFLLSKTKAIVDGLIATLNYHDGTDEREICHRLAQRIGVDSHEIAKLLRVQEGALFGRSRLIKLWRDTVQWNPQDDRCLVGEILIRSSEQNSEFVLVSEIFEIRSTAI